MAERIAKGNLEKLIKLEKMFKSHKVVIRSMNLPPTGMPGDSEEWNPTDFSITIQGESIPYIFVNTKNKTAEAYHSRTAQQELSIHPREKAKRMMGEYRESLNTLRRHNYKIKFKKILGPQDSQIVT